MTSMRTRIARLTIASALALCLAGPLASSAFAAVSEITISPTAQLSPGRLHVTLTGTVTCDAGTTSYLNAQIVQARTGSGYGSTAVACDGTQQSYAIVVSSSGFTSPTVFKHGKAAAQVSNVTCEPFPSMTCTTKYADATIRLAS